MKHSTPIVGVISVSLICLLDAARADEGDALNFYVGQAFRHESNLFRVADESAAPDGKQYDRISETTVGLKFDRTYGRQHIFADLSLLSERFDVHSKLNHDSPDIRLGLGWELGNRWSGVVSHSYQESLIGFDETAARERNLNTYERSLATADFWWHPRWATGVGVARTRNRFDQDELAQSEFESHSVEANLTYRPPTGNRVILTLRDTDGEYPNRPAVAGSIREYRQREVRLGGEWQLTGATGLTGFIGRTRVEYEHAPDRDFSGTIGRISVLWRPTVKTSVEATVRREVGAQQDRTTNYAIVDAVTLSPRWLVTEKVAVGAGLEWRRRDFRGEPLLPGLEPIRGKAAERSHRYRLYAEYRPMRALTLELNLQRQVRRGSNSFSGYSANIAEVSANFEF